MVVRVWSASTHYVKSIQNENPRIKVKKAFLGLGLKVSPAKNAGKSRVLFWSK